MNEFGVHIQGVREVFVIQCGGGGSTNIRRIFFRRCFAGRSAEAAVGC